MTAISNTVFLLIIVAIFPESTNGLRLTIQPDFYTEDNQGPIHFSCVPHQEDCDTENTNLTIVRLEIGQPGTRTMAGTCILPNYPVCTERDDSRTNKVDGKIDPHDIDKTFLTASVKARNEASGEYSCTVHCSNGSSVVKKRAVHRNLTVDIVDSNTVRGLRAMVMDLTQKLEKQENKALELSTEMRNATSNLKEKDRVIADIKTHLKDATDTLMDKDHELSTKVRNLDETVDELGNVTSDLKKKDHELSTKVRNLDETVDELGNVTSDLKKKVCPKGYSEFRGSCYGFPDKKATYDDARTYCEKGNGHLAMSRGVEENDFIKSIRPTSIRINWLGGTDKLKEGQFIWEDGSTMEWTNWSAGEPNNRSNEDCITMRYDKTWNDFPCENDQKFNFVCSIHISKLDSKNTHPVIDPKTEPEVERTTQKRTNHESDDDFLGEVYDFMMRLGDWK